MMMKILPILLILLGAGAGIGAGIMLKPDAPKVTSDEGTEAGKGEPEKAHVARSKGKNDYAEGPEYVQLNNQFVIPVVSDDLVESLVVMSLGLEVSPGRSEIVYQVEPKLRDALLQVMFDHANIGGFRGRFTDGNTMDVLRTALTEAAQGVVGDFVSGVLITDIARQDV